MCERNKFRCWGRIFIDTYIYLFVSISVSELKEAIERRCGVMAAHQVLLMSGGESLEPNARVCSYSAGTDTNPIYLFSKAAIESHVPPTPHTDYSSGKFFFLFSFFYPSSIYDDVYVHSRPGNIGMSSLHRLGVDSNRLDNVRHYDQTQSR